MLYLFEILVFLLSAIYAFVSLVQWYPALGSRSPASSGRIRLTLALLPPTALAIIVWTLRNLASFDVVEDGFYLLMYILLGLAWAFFGSFLMFAVLDLSRVDDLIGMHNSAAAIAFSGGFLAITLIYAGANIGDGPGCWCVLLAGGLGLVTWLALGYALNLLSGAFERITVERNVAAGIRTGSFLLAIGLIIARASAGDWTSFAHTIVEFMVGWPVLPFTAVAILIERAFRRPPAASSDGTPAPQGIGSSVLIGAVYIVAAVLILCLLPPMVENPMYGRY